MIKKTGLFILAGLFSLPVFAAGSGVTIDLTAHWVGYTCLAIFVLAYAVVIMEEHLHLRKSKPVIVAAGIIWALIATMYAISGDKHTAEAAVRHNILEFAELFLFLLAAMTYINTMDERGVFQALRAWLVSQGFSLRTIFWLTGGLAFFISPVADNLTTALLMATVAIAVGGKNIKFVAVACINIVVAANAGGAFSPFGDITTLMVWQKGIVKFEEFFALFIPSVVNWLIPAAIMSLTVPKSKPEGLHEDVKLKHGAFVVVGLFILTIIMAVMAHNYLHLPPVLGMMTGLGFLKFYGYYLKRHETAIFQKSNHFFGENNLQGKVETAFSRDEAAKRQPFNIFKSIERAEWDTLIFFYGIILCVGGLGLIGYLAMISQTLYVDLGPTTANILIGVLSAFIDNIPVMFAVLTMMPEMDLEQWLLVTLTTGVGGSLLSIGSAAGVALMGQARGVYTFFAHLKWTWAIALGYVASVWLHLLIN